ncbi:MAG: class I SAM-dependent methyltransferase [Anaerolineae bacterium]
MHWAWDLAIVGFAGAFLLWLPHVLSYHVLKSRIVRRQRWGLNICCGTTDGGGVNADIVAHAKLPRFVYVTTYRLPFPTGQFDNVLCSHTLEHVEDPEAFYRELRRVGRNVTIVLPPLWDLTAAFNLLEHRWLFLTLRKEHIKLPPYIRLPGAGLVQKLLGQRIRA